MQKGQQFSVFKLLIGAIFALAFMGIVYNVIVSVTEYQPGSDVFTVSSDVLASAYSAAGTGQGFSRKAQLQPQVFSAEAVMVKAGLSPLKAEVGIYCNHEYCLYDGEAGECEFSGSVSGIGCDWIELTGGAEVQVCAVCEATSPKIECHLFFGEKDCWTHL